MGIGYVFYEAKWDQAARDEYLKSHPQNFAGPDGSFPIRDASDVGDAWNLAGHAVDPDAVRAKIKEIAARMGFSDALPDTAKEKQESATGGFISGSGMVIVGEPGPEVITIPKGTQVFPRGVQESARPQKKIGTLPICWLEYNARSLNGRIYPKATCDAIFRSAQQVISDPDALPPTTFVSHEAANGNVNTDLVGAPVKVWQEGSKFWAHIDIADTSVARDILGLVEGGYLKSGSMRVAGVELLHDRNYDLPLVVVQEGVTPQFLGIDLTTRPGLDKIARIPQVLYESNGQEPYIESFTFETLPIEGREEPPAMKIPIYLQAALGMLQEAKSSREAHTAVHDHIAGVMDECMGAKHGSESARYKALIEGQLDEAGRAIAMKHAVRLAAAHDESAHQLGMKCEGCYKEAFAPSDTDNDGDNPAAGNDPDHDGESAHQEGKNILTEQEMLAALKAKGFTIEAPKTAEQKKIEEQDAKLAALEAKIAQLTETAPQRQTLANQSQFEESSTLQEEVLYQEGDYLAGDLAPKNWRALANRRVPWPKDIDPKLALHEMAPFMAHALNAQEAHARGRSIDAFIQPNEIM